MTPRQAAEQSGYSYSHMKALCRSGKVKCRTLNTTPKGEGYQPSYEYDISEKELQKFLNCIKTETRGRPRNGKEKK